MQSNQVPARGSRLGSALLLALAVLTPGAVSAQSANTPPETAQTPPPPAKGVIVLFGGKNEDLQANWLRGGSTQPAAWKINGDAMVAGGGSIMTREKFTDLQLHIEFKPPYKPEARGQARGNSGVYLQGRYEIQVLDSFGIAEPGKGDCGAVYNQAAPLINACKDPRQWQSYDIIFRAPRLGPDGKVLEKARVTILLNGIAIQSNQEINGPTGGEMDREIAQPGPILLQDHGNPVEYRNVWVLPLPAQGAAHY